MIKPLSPGLDLPETHSLLGWPHHATCECGAAATLLCSVLEAATYECRGTPSDPSRSVYGVDRCSRVFEVKRGDSA